MPSTVSADLRIVGRFVFAGNAMARLHGNRAVSFAHCEFGIDGANYVQSFL
jgi:hypothetical protein